LLDATLKESDRPAVNPVARSSECRYEATDGTRVLVLQLEELANPAARLEQFRQMWTDAETIDGLGDYAFYAASQLFVFEGDHQLVLTLGMPGRPPAERRERATEAAGTAVSRLPGGSG
jgi:hypothetical protein